MLYSSGGATIWIGYVTSYVGQTSSSKIGAKGRVTAATGYTTPTSASNSLQPITPPNAPPGAGSGGPSTVVTEDTDSGGSEPTVQPPLPDSITKNAALAAPGNPAILGQGSVSAPQPPQPPPQPIINITRPVVINSVQLSWLGTGKVAPRIRIRRRFRPIYQSDAGKQVEYDKAYSGQDAIIEMKLNNWNEYTYAQLAARVNQRSQGGGPRGVDTQDSIGSLMLTEGLAYMLFIQFPNAAKPVMQAAGMPAGYRFFAAYPLIEDVRPGLPANELQLTWHALKLYDFRTGNQWLFDHDMSNVPTLASVY